MLELGWLFTVPVLKLAIKIALSLISLFLGIQVGLSACSVFFVLSKYETCNQKRKVIKASS